MKQEQIIFLKKEWSAAEKQTMIEMKTSMKRLEDIPASKETKRKNIREK